MHAIGSWTLPVGVSRECIHEIIALFSPKCGCIDSLIINERFTYVQ